MIGISYGGISQLFVAATDPPDLAAIAPLSVIDNTATTLYPGGILNTGFARAVRQGARPRRRARFAGPRGGVGAGADPRWRRTCRGQPGAAPGGGQRGGRGERQPLLRAVGGEPAEPDHVRAQDPRARVPRLPVDRRADRRALPGPRRALHRHATEVVHVHQRRAHRLTRSRHRCAGTTSCSCSSRSRLPDLSPSVRALAPVLYQIAMGVSGVTFPADDPIENEPDYAAALAAFERCAADPDPVRQRRRRARRRARRCRRSSSRSRGSRCPGTQAASWYLGLGGHAAAGPPPGVGRRRHVHLESEARGRRPTSRGNTGPGGLWGTSPSYHWTQNPPGTALSYLTAPLRSEPGRRRRGSASGVDRGLDAATSTSR